MTTTDQKQIAKALINPKEKEILVEDIIDQTNLPEREVFKQLRSLAEAGAGRLILGRRQHKSRFKITNPEELFYENAVEQVLAPLREAKGTRPAPVVDVEVEMKEAAPTYRFPVRKGHMIELPEDLTQEEADRLIALIEASVA